MSGEDAFMLAPLRDQTAGEAPAAPTLDYRPRDGWNATSPSILQLTGPQPHDFRPASHAGLSHQFAPPTGLMTPSSDNTTGERDYLNTDEEIQLMQVFIDEVSIWMGALDKGKHFATTVPYLALKLPMLLNGLMACGARHLAQTATLDGEKAADYYRTAIIQLQRSQRERDADVSECALTAIVLDAYHIMTDKPTQRMHHIDSTRQLVRECGWDASSTGLGAACFWVNVGMEVLSCMSLNRPTTRDPDDWGMDLDFATLGAASRSGSRSVAGSVAGSDDVWSARAGGPRAMSVNDASDPDDEGLWVQRIFYILAKVSNFRANTPRVQESSPHDEQVRLQNRYAEWRRLQNMCTSWNHHSPRSMRPYGYSPGPSPQSLFPNVWYVPYYLTPFVSPSLHPNQNSPKQVNPTPLQTRPPLLPHRNAPPYPAGPLTQHRPPADLTGTAAPRAPRLRHRRPHAHNPRRTRRPRRCVGCDSLFGRCRRCADRRKGEGGGTEGARKSGERDGMVVGRRGGGFERGVGVGWWKRGWPGWGGRVAAFG